MGADEALTPEAALDLFLADQSDLTHIRRVATGARADLVLMQQPWRKLRKTLVEAPVRATIIDGHVVHDGIDEAPFVEQSSTDPSV